MQLKAILETENPHSSPITYNPQKNIIALTSNATGMLGKAQRVLQNLVDDFSSDLGSQYLIAFDKDEWPSTERQITSTSNTQNGGRGERSKMYEIRPKDDTRLVIIWLKFILPNLSQILEPRIGRTYTASLVRLGRSELDANPCIQIECPFIPDQAGQESIMNILTTIYKANSYHQAISIRFFQGHVRMLNGGDDDNGDAASTNNLEAQRVRFSFNRPFSKLRMGASLGLLCSTKVSGTLGGFVFIEGKTYILTSQHFVTRSQDSVSPRRLAVDENAVDDKILTSPSVSDLYLMENSLKQKLRDSRGKINDLMTGTYGDQYISSSFLSDLTCLPEPLKEARQWQEQVKSLLKQVRRPPDKYEVGRIFRQRTEATRSAFYPRPLAHSLGLSNDSLIHTMDWCLCKSNNENAENRHKYRSTLAAKIDAYIEEADHNDQPGELCHDICEVEPAVAVYYVGQGSGRRDGRVNGALVATSCGSSASQEWSIISSDAQWLDYNDVQGDSGAWVIRQRDNKLMGQVHGHASGQVLFTPIKVIFDDMRSQFGANVSLPPSPLAPALAPIQIQSMPLCGVRDENDPNPYSQITSTPPSLETLKPHFVTHEPEETKHQEINNGEVENREANKFFRQRDDSFSSLPSLTEASLSSSSKSPNQSDEETGVDEIQPTNFDSLSGKHANANIRPLIADSETRDYTKHLITKFSEMKHAISLRISRSGRVTTWPIYTKGNIGKPRLEGRWMRKLKRGGDKGFDDNAGRLPRSEGAVGTNIDISLRQLQRSLTVFPWNPRFQAEPETSEARSFRILYTI